ncbi:hypothetical protein [Paludisphaera soli]|uniref:hypothetical protein n=1 Tax=Paludisphaera soli TaxID=2712865 RepID=UPI0013EAD181|nr:hypothetical protein [Paludisphaera soli]
MESSLHRSLKEHFGTLRGGRCEVAVEGFRIDAVDAEGTLIEIQSGSLGSLRPKLGRLLPHHRMRVIRPIVLRRTVVRRDRAEGPDLSRRRSPRRGSLTDVFDDLVGLAPFLPDPNLGVDLLGVDVEEVRVTRRRRPGYVVVDRRLVEIVESSRLYSPVDLWDLLPPGFQPGDQFTTADLARKLGRPLYFAQRVAYCLRVAGAAETVGKRGNSLIYRAVGDVAALT